MINPARAFGPQLVANAWSGWGEFWIWYVGPFAGAAIAALLYDELFLRSSQSSAPSTAARERPMDTPPPPPPPPPPPAPASADSPPA